MSYLLRLSFNILLMPLFRLISFDISLSISSFDCVVTFLGLFIRPFLLSFLSVVFLYWLIAVFSLLMAVALSVILFWGFFSITLVSTLFGSFPSFIAFSLSMVVPFHCFPLLFFLVSVLLLFGCLLPFDSPLVCFDGFFQLFFPQ